MQKVNEEVLMKFIVYEFPDAILSNFENNSALLCHPTERGMIFFPTDDKAVYMSAANALLGSYDMKKWGNLACDNYDDIAAFVKAGKTFYIAPITCTAYMPIRSTDLGVIIAFMAHTIPVGILPSKYHKYWRQGELGGKLEFIYVQDTLF